MKKRVRLGILLLIIFGGYALRVHQLDRFSFWLDEGLTPLRSSYAVRAILSNVIVIQAANSQDTHPPLYYLLIHLTRQLFGTSDFAFRYPSVLLSVLLIPVLARFGRKVSVAFIRLTTKARRREDITLTTEHLFSLLIALLVAINPQQIWYAQEARMYSQLVLLMAVASYILWDAWHNPARPLWQSVMGYAVFAGLAAYTHYTALFLIVGQSPMWLWLLWRSGQKRLILAGGIGAIVVALPFAPFVIKRLLGPDETSYFPVAPQVFIADIVRGFGFGRTVDYAHPSITFLLLMLSAILLYGIWRAQRATRLFLLIYLLATVFGLMAGSYIFKPMYLGPHHIMVGSPAFILLLALGIWHMPMPKVGRLLALGLVLWAQGVSLRNFYFDSAYAKEDYRALVQFIEARAGEHDLVLYNDAILLPLQQHYQQRADLPFTASPMYPYSLDDARNPAVADVVAGYERVWFVPAHPSDGRDDAGVVEAALQEMGAVFLQQPFHGRNADVRVDGYAIGTQMAQLPDDAKLLANPMLPLAVRVSDVEWRSLWVELFWDGGMVSAETEITIQLRDTTNTVWSSYTSQFLAEASAPIVKTTHGLQLPLGLPPATYQLWINVGEWQQLTTVEIVASVSAETTPSPTGIMFENGIELVSVELAAETTFAGNPLPATLLWRIHDLQALPDSEFELTVLGSAGELRRDKQPLLADWVAAEKLTPNTLFAQQIGIYPRPDTAPDTYRLLWKLLQAGQPQVTAQGLDSAEMGRFSVLAWPFVSEIPAVDNLVDSVDNSFGDDITLQAFTISDNEPAAGEQLAITLYWQPLAQPAANWSVFVHLVQSAADQPLAQANGTPVNGLRPTKGWRPQEIIRDEYQLQLPADLSAGSYQIYVGFFDTETFARYPVVVDGIAQPFDQLLLTTIQVR